MIPLKSRVDLAALLEAAPDTSHLAGDALAPQVDDLYTLYAFARLNAVVSAVELGAGWSTLVLAHAIAENAASFGTGYDARHPQPFHLWSLEADHHWAKVASARLFPPPLAEHHTMVVCDVVPDGPGHAFKVWLPEASAADLIYIDGPDPGQGRTSPRGQSPDQHGLPMSADVAAVEPHLWPGVTVIVDGRTANARFLASRLQRRWQIWEDPFGDRTWMRLDEAPLGRHNRRHLDLRLAAADKLRAGPGGTWGEPL